MTEDSTATRFDDRVRLAMRRADSLVCIGLDPDLARFPALLRELPVTEAIVRFNTAIIDATTDLVCAYKPNLGFYLAYGLDGLAALAETRRRIPSEVPVILDGKFNDMGATATAYARGCFETWRFDAVTANPYLGEDALTPYFAYPNRGVLVLCKTSNPGSGDVQDLDVRGARGEAEPLYLTIASRAAAWATRYPASVGLVVGATYPAQLAAVRERCPDLPILLPGIGAQAGDLDGAVRAGVDAQGEGLLVSSSRAITFAGDGDDFAERARDATIALRDAINTIRAEVTAPVLA